MTAEEKEREKERLLAGYGHVIKACKYRVMRLSSARLISKLIQLDGADRLCHVDRTFLCTQMTGA